MLFILLIFCVNIDIIIILGHIIDNNIVDNIKSAYGTQTVQINCIMSTFVYLC